jgi:hypothetical protein
VLFRAHALLLWRAARPQLWRALLYLCVSVVLSLAAVQNGNVSPTSALPGYATRFLVPALVFGMAGLLRPSHEAELKLAWVAAPTQTPTRWGAAVNQLFGWGLFSALGSLHATVLATLLHLEPRTAVYLIAEQLLTSGAFSLILGATQRWVFEKAVLSTRRVLLTSGELLFVSEVLFFNLAPLALQLLLATVSLSLLGYWGRLLCYKEPTRTHFTAGAA